jgi:L-iduronidase
MQFIVYAPWHILFADRYGLATVAQWRFETWNEPDLKNYNILKFTLQSK